MYKLSITQKIRISNEIIEIENILKPFPSFIVFTLVIVLIVDWQRVIEGEASLEPAKWSLPAWVAAANTLPDLPGLKVTIA